MNPEEAESFATKCVIGIAICIAIILITIITWDGTGEPPGDNPVCILAAVMIFVLLMAGAMAGEIGNNSHSTTTKKSRQKKRRKCSFCRKEGHTKRTCPDKKKQEKEVKQPGSMAQMEVGRVDKYFRKAGVAALKLSAAIAVGDKLRFSGSTTDFEMKLESMQIHRKMVERAAAGADVGIAVPERVRRSDTVFRVRTAKEEYWSFTCVGVEEEKCGEKIFIENWVRDVIVNYQKARDSDKGLMDDDEAVREAAYDNLDRTFELKNEKGETMDIQCPKCSMTIPYQWDLDPGGKPEDWVRDTPPYHLMRIEMYSHYELGKWKREKTRAERKAEGEKKVLADFSKSMDRVLGKKSSKSLDNLVEDFIANDSGNIGIPGMSKRDMEFLGNLENKRLCMGCNEEIPLGHFKCLMCGSQSFYNVKRDKTEKKDPRRRKNKKTDLGQFSDGPDRKSLARRVSRPSKGLGKVLKEEAESLMTYYCNSCGYAFKMISMGSGDHGQTCMKCGSSDLESESTPIETDDSVRSFMYE